VLKDKFELGGFGVKSLIFAVLIAIGVIIYLAVLILLKSEELTWGLDLLKQKLAPLRQKPPFVHKRHRQRHTPRRRMGLIKKPRLQ
jgi:hypothetical protein